MGLCGQGEATEQAVEIEAVKGFHNGDGGGHGC
jgi:hypothetical protein